MFSKLTGFHVAVVAAVDDLSSTGEELSADVDSVCPLGGSSSPISPCWSRVIRSLTEDELPLLVGAYGRSVITADVVVTQGGATGAGPGWVSWVNCGGV